jgi:ribA/ribD-fused uncharacterized protein
MNEGRAKLESVSNAFLAKGIYFQVKQHIVSAIIDVESLKREVKAGYRPKFLFFWGHHPRRDGQIGKGCLSQWWSSPLEIDGVTYPTAEHYMMAQKAKLFEDLDTLNKILVAPHPGAAKDLGRSVVGFDEQLWQQHRYEIVLRGNKAKFAQNKELYTFLLRSKNRILVEASPVDSIWGIGLAADDPLAMNPAKWKGLNLLGFALMEVRSLLSEGLDKGK